MFWGKIIYATPGTGKTYVASKYRDVYDADDLIVQSIKELYDWFRFRNFDDPRYAIAQFFRYIHFNRSKMSEVYELAKEKMLYHCSQNDVVLLGTKDLIYMADIAFVQRNEYIVREGFNQESELSRIEDDFHDESEIYYIEDYLDGCLQKLCAGRL
jgi:hypothetical protein